jgi:hypothetical protein
VAFAAKANKVQSLFIVADGAVIIKTNNITTPGNTFTLAANSPYSWISGDAAITDTGGTALVDVTSLFVTLSGTPTADVLLQIRALVDPT